MSTKQQWIREKMTKQERIEAFNGSEKASFFDLQIEKLGMDYYLCQDHAEDDRVFTLLDIHRLMLTLTEAKEIMEMSDV